MSLTLPEATGGTFTYSLTPVVPGLTFERRHPRTQRYADQGRDVSLDLFRNGYPGYPGFSELRRYGATISPRYLDRNPPMG